MKPHRIYGVKKGLSFCHFPRGNHVMKDIKIQCYRKKKIRTFFGTNLKQHDEVWKFNIGEVECYIYEKTDNKYRVNDTNHDIFEHNQLAGVFMMSKFIPHDLDDMELFNQNVADEVVRLLDCKVPPYRDVDTTLMSLLRHSSYKSPVTKQCARNREVLTHLLETKMHKYEIEARNSIWITNCNSLINRFGKERVYNEYIVSTKFFELVFEFIDQYFFSNVLKELAVWSFKPTETNDSSILISVNTEKINSKDIKELTQICQKEICHILVDFLTHSVNVLQTPKYYNTVIMSHYFGLLYEKPSGIFSYKMISVPKEEYQKLFGQTHLFMT